MKKLTGLILLLLALAALLLRCAAPGSFRLVSSGSMSGEEDPGRAIPDGKRVPQAAIPSGTDADRPPRESTSSAVPVDRPAAVPDGTTVAGTVERPREEQVLEALRLTVRTFGQRFRGNPVGNNAEITAALNGGNPGGVRFLDGQEERINSKGELTDEWGTPYFFHQVSGTEMEIRSAGPDRTLWTGDDLEVK